MLETARWIVAEVLHLFSIRHFSFERRRTENAGQKIWEKDFWISPLEH
jgi:hypothetical protein